MRIALYREAPARITVSCVNREYTVRVGSFATHWPYSADSILRLAERVKDRVRSHLVSWAVVEVDPRLTMPRRKAAVEEVYRHAWTQYLAVLVEEEEVVGRS